MPPTADDQLLQPATNSNKTEVAVHWYRHGLRIHDNPSLFDAVDKGREVYCIFIFDGEVAGTKNAGYNRMRFLHENLTDLDQSLRKYGGRLYVFHGDPLHILPSLFEEWGVTLLTFEQDPEPIWQDRDQAVKDMCAEKGVVVTEEISHTLYDPDKVIAANGGRPPHTFSLLQQVLSLLGAPPHPLPTPSLSDTRFPVPDDFDEKFALPSLDELGVKVEFEEQKNPINKWKGGETHALELFKERLKVEEKAFQDGYTMPNQHVPDLLGPPRTLSPHLRFGCISVRHFFWAIHDLYNKTRGGPPPISLTSQLLWREYFYIMSINNPNYAVMKDNPICLQIPWYHNDEQLKKWEMGKTGFPWIDACMNQLRHEGWIHHVARHAVSCFLTRGDLWIHWEDGLELFFKYQLDADWSVCAGNWMWVSSSAFENCLQCPQCFSPIMYGMRMDPTGEYVRRYVPELKKMPLKYLFMPWKAPLSVQREAGCVVGQDYPEPMVDHASASRRCQDMMQRVKALYKDPDVLHCAPSNTEEVLKFCWLPSAQSSQRPCSSSADCHSLEMDTD